jgi:tetratricopeptide (TPR) repeat protein
MAPRRNDSGAHRRMRTPRMDKRLHCIPPAIMREPDEKIEGIYVLEEHKNNNDVARLLFRTVRAVTLWASTAPEKRRGLFADENDTKDSAALEEVRIDPLLEIHLLPLLVVSSDPLNAPPDQVTSACLAVADWTAARGALGTALAFAQAAAVASPEDPRPAREAGRYASRWGRIARAESWMRVAVGLARRAGDWKTYTQAVVALGDIHAQRLELGKARHAYQMACRSSRRHALREERARALYGLFVAEMQLGQLEEAYRHAQLALRAHRRSKRRRPAVLLDFASLLILRGEDAEAAPILEEALATVEGEQRALGLALLARATAPTDRRRYSLAWAAAWEHMRRLARGEGRQEHVLILLHLAHAASLANDRRAVREIGEWYAAQPRLFDPDTHEHLASLAARARGSDG